MEEIQSWLSNDNNSTSNSSPPSYSSSATTSETHSAPTLCEDSTFESTQIISRSSFSHFCIASIKTTTPQISCLAIHNNNLYAATLKEINVFDLTTLSIVQTFGSGSGWAKSIAFSDGKIFTAHQDSKIRVWKISSKQKQKPQLISTLPTLKDRFFKCMLAKNYVQVRRHKRNLWIQHADAVSGLAANDDGSLYSVSWDKTFKAWKTTSSDMRCLDSVRAHTDAVNAVVVNPLDGTVITGSADGLIKIWRMSEDGKEHRLITTLSRHESSVNALSLDRVGSVLFSGGGDHVINVWDKAGDENEENSSFVFCCCLKGHRGAILSLVHVKGDVLISGSSDRSVRIWKHGKDYCCLAIMEGHSKPVKSVVAVPGDHLDHLMTVYSGSLDGEIRAWKVVICNDTW